MEFSREEKAHRARAAADPISSLPDEWVSADTLRKFVEDWREGLATAPRGNYEAEMLDDLEDMLPASPAPRTMAEIEWDNAEHHLAEASVAVEKLDGNISDTVIMLGVNRFGNVSALDTSTWAAWALSTDTLTPTGRKYRLEPEDDVAYATGGALTTQDVVDECRAVRKERAAAESASSRPKDVPEGDVWAVSTPFADGVGYRSAKQSIPWFVTYPDHTEQRTWNVWDDADITLLHRLVPETTEQDNEQEFDPAFVYHDRSGYKWAYVAGGWRLGGNVISRPHSAPPAKYGPYTRIEDTK